MSQSQFALATKKILGHPTPVDLKGPAGKSPKRTTTRILDLGQCLRAFISGSAVPGCAGVWKVRAGMLTEPGLFKRCEARRGRGGACVKGGGEAASNRAATPVLGVGG
jgi:hypothetical protein